MTNEEILQKLAEDIHLGLNNLMQWIPSKKRFFLPVKVVSQKFRGKFLALLIIYGHYQIEKKSKK